VHTLQCFSGVCVAQSLVSCLEKSLKTPKGKSSFKSKQDRKYNGQQKKTKGQAMSYKTLHRKLKIEYAFTPGL
jgi:hypothetical protein